MKGNQSINNSQDIIDSRDIIERIEYLEGLDTEIDEDDKAELETLRKLAEEAEGYAEDWKYGSALIRDSYMEDYAKETAEDIGAITNDMAWPCTCIDWERATDEFKQDYTEIDFDGVTYWIR